MRKRKKIKSLNQKTQNLEKKKRKRVFGKRGGESLLNGHELEYELEQQVIIQENGFDGGELKQINRIKKDLKIMRIL